MRGNSRIIALSLVAIVLGAGYLMRVIPPAADIDVADNDAVTIDGTVVTNPLNLAEIVPPAPAADQEQRPIAKIGSAPINQLPPDASLFSLPSDPVAGAFLSPPIDSVSEGTPEGQKPETTPSPETNSGLPPPRPNFESYPPLIPALANPNRSTPDSPGGGGGGRNPPTDMPDEPGDDKPNPDIIKLPTDPRSTGPSLPDKDKPFAPGPDFGPINQSDDHPIHQVPDSGSTLALTALSIAAIAALRRR